MSDVKRVLIAGLSTEVGGMETYIMNIYRRIDREKLQFDFVNFQKNGKLAFADEIIALGGNIIDIPKISDGFLEHHSKLIQLFQDNDYTAVYYQANRKLKNADLFKYATKFGVPHRIIHSHNTKVLDDSLISKIRAFFTARTLNRYLTDRFACSSEAAEWMFPNDKTVKVINNGIDVDLFDYNKSKGDEIKNKYGLIGKKVYGTVGRMCKAKNSLFLVDVFNETHKLDSNSVFIHLGGGPLEDELKARIQELNLEDSYILCGRVNNVNDYLNAMDVLLLPSEHEGFPISLVESQCSGLRCLVANNITQSVNFTGNIYYKDIHESAHDWAENAVKLSEYERVSNRQKVIDCGFDENEIVDWFVKYIMA